ncbi:hypothetical protein [Halomonas sp. WWR20]
MATLGSVNVTEFHNGGDDWAAAFQAAIDTGKAVVVPRGYYTITPPLVIPGGWCGIIRGENQIECIIRNSGANQDPDTYMFEYNRDGGFSWGIIVENIHLQGMGFENGAFFLKECAYPLFRNVNIEGFNGSALAIDKCQDGNFQECNIQSSGRNVGDSSQNSETTHPAINLFTTVAGDACNMLRFTACQIESNRCSPYVRVDKGIGIMFVDVHGEIRRSEEWETRDFLENNGADVTFTNCALDRFRNALVQNGYGRVTVTGGRKFGSIDATGADGKTGRLVVSDTQVGDIKLTSWKGVHSVRGVEMGALSVRYGSGSFNVSDSKLSSVDVQLVGAGARGVKLRDCFVQGNVNFSSSSRLGAMIDCSVEGDCTFKSNNGDYVRNRVTGTETLA